MRLHKGESLIKDLDDYTVLDIETTSLDSKDGEILEISALKIRGKKVVGEFSKILKVNYLNDFTINLTGITEKLVLKYGEEPEKVLQEFLDFLGSDVIVGHNVNFDINFLYDNLKSKLDVYLTNNYVDTLRLSRMFLPFLSHHRLDDLISYFNLKKRHEHRALNDCKLTNQVYLHLCELLKKVGV